MFDVSFTGRVAGLFHSADVAELMGREAPLSLDEAIAHAGVDPARFVDLGHEAALALLTEDGRVPLTAEARASLEELSGGPAR